MANPAKIGIAFLNEISYRLISSESPALVHESFPDNVRFNNQFHPNLTDITSVYCKAELGQLVFLFLFFLFFPL